MQPRACRGLALQCSCMAGTRVCTFAFTTRQCLWRKGHCECRPELTDSPPSRRSTACALFAGGVRHPAALPSTAARFAMRTACTLS